MSLTKLLNEPGRSGISLDRSPLNTQSTELLRNHIINGRIPQGTRLVEQELADLLGISRMPARDALMNLEHEGLVINRPNGRYVIEVDQTAIAHLFQVRLVLERLAVALAAQKRDELRNTALTTNLKQMREAIVNKDRAAYVKSDLEAHQIIWQQAENPYLLKMLSSIIGPIFMFISSQTEFQLDWDETLQLHEELANAICTGNSEGAVQSIERQLGNSLQLSQRVFENQGSA